MPLGGLPASFCIQYPIETMLPLVSGPPRAFRMASDQASWFCPVGVSSPAVAGGVTEPEADEDEDVADAVGRGRAGAIGELVSLGRRTGPAVGRGLDGVLGSRLDAI